LGDEGGIVDVGCAGKSEMTVSSLGHNTKQSLGMEYRAKVIAEHQFSLFTRACDHIAPELGFITNLFDDPYVDGGVNISCAEIPVLSLSCEIQRARYPGSRFCITRLSNERVPLVAAWAKPAQKGAPGACLA
jgi:hypothetical protein